MKGFFRETGKLLAFVSVLLVAAGSWLWVDWLRDLARTLTWHAGLLAAVAAVCFLLGRKLLFALVTTALAVWLWLPWAELVRTPAEPQSPGPELVLLSANVHSSNERHGPLEAVVAERDPDVIVLFEVTMAWEEWLREKVDVYTAQWVEPRRDNFGLALASRYPVKDATLHRDDDTGVPWIEADVILPDCSLRVIAVHAVPPAGEMATTDRNRILRRVMRQGWDADRAAVVGDFNASMDSPVFVEMQRTGELRDSRVGIGRQPTWPTWLGPFGLDLDHVLLRGEVQVASRELGPNIGSDHFPLITTLRMTSCGAAAGASGQSEGSAAAAGSGELPTSE